MAMTRPYDRALGSAVYARRAALWIILFAIELFFFFLFFALYFVGRGFQEDKRTAGTANAEYLIDLERTLGVFWEPTWHRFALDHDWLIHFSSFTYIHLHLSTVLVLGLVFYIKDRRKYRVLRNALLLSGFLAMPFYWFFPVTPPRLLELNGIDLGFVDAAADFRGSKAGILTNNYAAVPSYHFGWIFLCVLGVWWTFKSWLPRVIMAVFLAWMTWCIVATANHYFIDMLAGGVMVTLALALSLRWERFISGRKAETMFFLKKDDYRVPF